MAFDGFAICNIIYEIKQKVLGGRVDKIYQPEKDEIIITIRNNKKIYKLLLTANASSPRLHLTDGQKENPINAPLFCMVLRKYLSSGKIVDITQPSFERIVNIHVESINELGDYSEKILVFEIMGRHSNIILIDSDKTVLECIKHISFSTSSVREVLPSRKYELPPSQNKKNPLDVTQEIMQNDIEKSDAINIQEFIYKSYNGISPIIASEMCSCANVDPDISLKNITKNDIEKIYKSFRKILDIAYNGKFSPQIIYENDIVKDFTVFDFTLFKMCDKKYFVSICELLQVFYTTKDQAYRMKQKSQDLKKFVEQNIARCVKKKEIQQKTLKDIEKREKIRLYGELITSNIYSIKKGMTKVCLNNFYSENNEEIEIRLDPELTPVENAQKYFKKYNKQKRTFVAMQEQIEQNDIEFLYLESVLNSITKCTDEKDIMEIRQELYEQGILKKPKNNKKDSRKNSKKANILHFVSEDGFHIYVGKNNTQNDELTLKMARADDMWLHTKNIPGSHVIIVSNGKKISNDAINVGANLAVFYSKAKNSSLVPVDYTLKKFVKKPNGAKPGMVIYETNKTAYITPNMKMIQALEKIT